MPGYKNVGQGIQIIPACALHYQITAFIAMDGIL
jgi:hypothetical protein